jgi:KUP system potassium uptake protein
VNWLLMVATIAVVVGFQNSSNVASAYGVALTATMLITTLLASVVTRRLWGWKLWQTAAVTAVFLTADLAFFGSMIVKLFAGGWFPLAVGAIVFTIMTTWYRGRALLAKRVQDNMVPLDDFLELLRVEPTARVPGTAVFMTSNPSGTPPALMNNFLHNHTVHARVLLLTIVVEEASRVDNRERVRVEDVKDGFTRIVAHYGFMESPDVVALLAMKDTPTPTLDYTTFFIGNEIVLPEGRAGMARWRMHLFSYLARNAARPTTYFNIPTQRVVEIGSQISM